MDTYNRLPSSIVRNTLKKLLIILLALTGIILVLWLDNWLINQSDRPELSQNMSYGLLLLVGFLTSFHCVGMCGPLILSYTAKGASQGHQTYYTHLLYGLGKTLSYTLIGGLFGAFGAIVAFTPQTQGIVGIIAGLFLLVFGLHMLEVFSVLNHFQVKMPRVLMQFIGKEYRKHGNPFYIGLLNGLMIICGPLQAMYIMAAGTGNWLDGMIILLCFGLGTLPLLLGFGFLTSLISKNLTPKLLKASGVIVMALGAVMLNRGLTVTGSGLDFNTWSTLIVQRLAPPAIDPVVQTEQTIYMDVLKNSFSPNRFTLHKDVPVNWVINGKELNRCNETIIVPRLGLKLPIKPGQQSVRFTPTESGVIAWSCWMGMIPGNFIVVDEPTHTLTETKPANQNSIKSLLAAFQQGYARISQMWQKWLTDILNALK